jgi:sulfite reductase alpha subunit-like flavoprotein
VTCRARAENSQRFFEWLRNEASPTDLTGVHFAVFGLGDSTYKHYNVMGLQCDGAFRPLSTTASLADFPHPPRASPHPILRLRRLLPPPSL